MTDLLIQVDAVSKKYCRSLKKSLLYGLRDIGNEMLGRRHDNNEELRSEEFWAVNNVSFELKRGECLGLIGHNGAGKSTLLKMLNGLIKPDKGLIKIKGRIGALIELGAGFNPILTGRENIYINGSVLGFKKKDIDRKFDEIVEFSECGEFLDSPVQNYSSGMRVRLGFAVAAQMEPDVLLIDEVLAVGDIGFKVKCLNRIGELLQHSAVIFVSHSMPFVSRICTDALVMKKGVSVGGVLNVSDAIDLYHGEFDSAVPRVVGNKDIEIIHVLVNGVIGNVQPCIQFGGALDVCLRLSINASCDQIGIRMALVNLDQRLIADVVDESYEMFIFNRIEDTFGISMTIPSLCLSAGKYTVSIGVYNPENGKVLGRIENAANFLMGQHISTNCDLFVPAKWALLSDA